MDNTPLPQPPAAAPPPQAAQPPTDRVALLKYLQAGGHYDPTQLAQAMGPTAAPPPQASAPQPAAPPAPAPAGIATAPPTMPPPMGVMPQLFNSNALPVGPTMRQVPGGQYVDSSQYGNYQHMTGQDRLPSYDSYLAAHPAGADALNGGPTSQSAILQQYLGLQKGQSQGDIDATSRMGVAGDLGVAQGKLGLDQSKQAFDQNPARIQEAAKLAVLQGGMSNPNSTPESFSTGIQNVNRLFPGPGGDPSMSGPPGQPPAGGLMMPGGQQAASGLTGSQQLLGEGLANQLASRPELKAAGPREKFDYITSLKGPDWVKQNFPALQSYLAEGTPGAADQLRASAHSSMAEQALKSPFALLGAAVQPANGGPRASLYSQQGRQKFGQAMDTPFSEQLGNFLGQPPTSSQNNNALLRAMMP